MTNESVEHIALLDMDGTVADYEEAMRRDLDLIKAPDEQSFPIHGPYPDYIKNRMRIIKLQPDWWFNLPKVKLGFDLYNEVRRLGFKVHVLTKGPWKTSAAWSEKLRWCRKHLHPEVGVTITEDKGLVYGKVLIDDYPEYMERWLKRRPRGLGIMPVKESNEGFEHPNVIKYDGSNMVQITEALIKAKERKTGR